MATYCSQSVQSSLDGGVKPSHRRATIHGIRTRHMHRVRVNCSAVCACLPLAQIVSRASYNDQGGGLGGGAPCSRQEFAALVNSRTRVAREPSNTLDGASLCVYCQGIYHYIPGAEYYGKRGRAWVLAEMARYVRLPPGAKTCGPLMRPAIVLMLSRAGVCLFGRPTVAQRVRACRPLLDNLSAHCRKPVEQE